MPTKSKEIRNRADVREVYFVSAEVTGLIKIGIANDAEKRFASLQSASPDALTLLGVVVSERAEHLESSLHSLLREDRARGEWYHPTELVMSAVRERALPPGFARFQFSRNAMLRAGRMSPVEVAESLMNHPQSPIRALSDTHTD